MPNFNGVEKFTVTNGGGTVNLDVSRSTTTRYYFSGTATLAAGYVIQSTGTPVEGMEFDIRWQAVVTTAGANVVTVFGTALTTAQALDDLIITVYYNGSAWDVDIQEDGIQDIWENGTGSNSVKLVNGGTSTSSGNTSINAGVDCTTDSPYTFVCGKSNQAISDYTHAEGHNTQAGGTASHSEGEDTIAGGDYSHAQNKGTTATGDWSHAEGLNTIADGHLTHAGGAYSNVTRYGEFGRGSGRISSGNTLQYSKLTMFVQTTNATPTLLFLDGSAGALSLINNSIIYFRGEGIAIQQAGSAGTVGDNASFHFNGCITSILGTTTLTDTVRWQDNAGAWGASTQRTQVANSATWTMVPTANNGTDTLDITVTGEANKTIYWLVNLELTEIRYTP